MNHSFESFKTYVTFMHKFPEKVIHCTKRINVY